MGYIIASVVIATHLVCSPPVHCKITKDPGACGSTKGCFSIPSDCNPDEDGSCSAFSSWSLTADNSALLINLLSTDTTYTYIALGFSKSGGMRDSDVYACMSQTGVVRSQNADNGRSNRRLRLIGVTDTNVVFANGTLSCSFKRVLEDNEGDSTFFNLNSPNKYTPIIAWGIAANGELIPHSLTNRGSKGRAIDFGGRGSYGNGSDASQKSHTTIIYFMLFLCFLLAPLLQ